MKFPGVLGHKKGEGKYIHKGVIEMYIDLEDLGMATDAGTGVDPEAAAEKKGEELGKKYELSPWAVGGIIAGTVVVGAAGGYGAARWMDGRRKADAAAPTSSNNGTGTPVPASSYSHE